MSRGPKGKDVSEDDWKKLDEEIKNSGDTRASEDSDLDDYLSDVQDGG